MMKGLILSGFERIFFGLYSRSMLYFAVPWEGLLFLFYL